MRTSPPILGAGFILSVLMIGLAALSHRFPYGVDASTAPLELYIIVALVASGVWASSVFQVRRSTGTIPVLWAIIGLGLVMRGAMFFSIPVLEDDSYRYLWDGAVTANGIDPYKYAPADASATSIFGDSAVEAATPDLAQLKSLADANAEPHSRINFPYVSTIYPPIAQAAFAIAHWIDPFGLTGWRFVLLISDLLTLFLLVKVLRAFDRSVIWASLYWWNPVVLVQGFGAGHMDLLVLPFLLLTLLFAKSDRTGVASLALAGGAAVKLWPIVLFPFLLRPFLNRPMKLAMLTSLFGGAVLLLLLPQAVHVLSPEAGLNAYASDWRTHTFIFAILEDFVFAPLEAPGQVARMVVAAMVVGLTGILALRFGDHPANLPILSALVIAALIFLSPTGYPWYLIWLAPFLAFLPRLGFITLFALAPLYWLRFQLGDDALIYQWVIVPIAFGIPLALLALPYIKRRPLDEIRHHHPRFE